MRRISLSLLNNLAKIYFFSLAGIFIAGIVFTKITISQEQENFIKISHEMSNRIERLISFNVDYLRYQLYYTANQIQFSKNLQNENIAKILGSFVPNINNHVDLAITWNAFSWINKNNKMIVDGSMGVIKNPPDMKDRDYLLTTSKTPNVLVFGKPVYGALSKRLVIPVALGIFSDNQSYLGTLVFGIDIERILLSIEKSTNDDAYSFAITQNDEIAFTSENFDKAKTSLVEEIAQKYQNNNNPSSGKTQTIQKQGIFSKNKEFITFTKIKSNQMGIVLFYDGKKSYQNLVNVAIKQAVFFILIILSITIIFQKIYLKIIKPVSELSEFATRITKKDFNMTLEKPKSRELKNLQDAMILVKDSFKKEKEMSDSLIQTTLEKEKIFSLLSHDLKNYIIGVSGLIRNFIDKKNNISTIDDLKMMQIVIDTSEEMRAIINDLLDHKNLSVDKLSLGKMTYCNVSEMIESMTILNNPLATKHDVSLSFETETNMPKLFCDEIRMKQVLMNLITNAIKYSKNQGAVKIAAKHVSDTNQILISIEDGGIGMNEEEIANYLRGEGGKINKTKYDKNFDSHGMGMKTVFHLLDLHGAKILVESKENIGTKVKLIFDLIPERLDNINVLLVDDDILILKAYKKALSSIGCHVETAIGGGEAIKILDSENKRFDLIFMDIEMPGLNGHEITKMIRQGIDESGNRFVYCSNFKNICIVAFTSNTSSELKKLCKESGMDLYIEKGSSKEKIIQILYQRFKKGFL